MPRKKPFDPWAYPEYKPAPVELPENGADAAPQLLRFAAGVWEETVALLDWSIELFHRPWKSRSWHRQARNWVGHLELLVRRIIMVLAFSMNLPPPRAWKPLRKPMGWRSISAMDPTTWKVTFRMTPRPPRESDGVQRERLPWTWPDRPSNGMSRRIEALRRAISRPHTFAQRYARRLARLKAINEKSNSPPTYVIKPWDFHPYRDRSAAHAVNDAMRLATPLAARGLEQWLATWRRPQEDAMPGLWHEPG